MFTKKTWKNRVTEFPTRRTLTKSNSSTEVVTWTRNEGEVYQEGDTFSAENMNDLEDRIYQTFSEIDSSLNGFSLVKTTESNKGSDPHTIYFCT